jgi:radical SAM superfamily enzyme YgiQ (UPF0313 family)
MASITFVNPNQFFVYEKHVHGKYQFPLGMAYAMSGLVGNHRIEILDASAENLTVEETVDRILNDNTEYAAFQCNTPLFPTVRSVCTLLKKKAPHIKTIVGSYHITILYDHVKDDCFDHLFVGEAEESLPAFLNTNMRPRIVKCSTELNIDRYPLPPRQLFYDEEQTDKRLGGPFTYMVTSRGCVGKCKYCIAGCRTSRVRFRSINNIRAELQQLHDLGISRISFEDDNFLLNPKGRFFELCNELGKWGFDYYIQATAKWINEDVLSALKDSGCSWLCYGIESGNDNILKEMGRFHDVDTNRRAVALTHKFGLKVRAAYLFGWINETEEQMQQTLNLIRELNADENAISIITPYPGTYIWDNYVSPKIDDMATVDWERFCYYNKVAWNLSAVSDERLLEIQQEAFSIRGRNSND